MREYLDEVRDQPVDVDRWQVEKLALAGVQNDVYFYAPGVTKAELGRLGAARLRHAGRSSGGDAAGIAWQRTRDAGAGRAVYVRARNGAGGLSGPSARRWAGLTSDEC